MAYSYHSASMRPGDFSPGNLGASRLGGSLDRSFNEAGGFLPRKLRAVRGRHPPVAHASMRPGDFSPGNSIEIAAISENIHRASMRPGDFSPGNWAARRVSSPTRCSLASMRPGDFSPGNAGADACDRTHAHAGFNEAGGFLPRKQILRPDTRSDRAAASMRPGDFSPGNAASVARPTSPLYVLQ